MLYFLYYNIKSENYLQNLLKYLLRSFMELEKILNRFSLQYYKAED